MLHRDGGKIDSSYAVFEPMEGSENLPALVLSIPECSRLPFIPLSMHQYLYIVVRPV